MSDFRQPPPGPPPARAEPAVAGAGGRDDFKALHFERRLGEWEGAGAQLAEDAGRTGGDREPREELPARGAARLEEGRGATVRDADGNTYLDFFGGAGTLNVGHGNPEAASGSGEQQRKLVHALDFPTRARLALMHALKEILPGALKRTARIHFGGPTGSDAVEAALKLVRSHTGRRAVVAFQGSYHGMTEGALAVTSDTTCGGPTDTPVHFMPYPYCYRCPLGLRPATCELACARLLESTLEDPHSGVPEPAGVIIEAIQGEGGTVVPPRG